MKKFFFSAVLAVAALVGATSCGQSVPNVSLKSDLDSLGYAYGLMFGTQYSNFQDSGVVVPKVTMDVDNFLAGFFTAFRRDSAKMKLTPEEAQNFIQKFNQELSRKMQEEREAEIAATKVKGADFMAENAKKEGVITLESGLQLQTLVEGTGKQPQDGDNVLVNYKGQLIDGTIFDQNDSTSFGVNQVVSGFKEGLMNMKEGGKTIMTMPSDLAYGDRGAGKIPAGSTLQFEVTLLKVTTPVKK